MNNEQKLVAFGLIANCAAIVLMGLGAWGFAIPLLAIGLMLTVLAYT